MPCCFLSSLYPVVISKPSMPRQNAFVCIVFVCLFVWEFMVTILEKDSKEVYLFLVLPN